jgi:desulfoferrodoxin (superoxide reductase-like protein)
VDHHDRETGSTPCVKPAVNESTSAKAPWPSRREVLLGVAVPLLGLSGRVREGAGAPGPRRRRADELADLSPFERLHYPVARLPVVTANGDRVPFVVEMTHPMEAGHAIEQVSVVNPRDPVPSKGVFRFTPESGQVYVAFQARMDAGPSEVQVTARCSVHGDWTTLQSVTVADGRGGCAAPGPTPERRAGADGLPPRLRIPQLVKTGRVRRDEVVDVQLSMRHPNRTGLAFRDGRFVPDTPPFHLDSLVAFHGEEPVCRFALTSALSDDPLITFRLRAGRGGLLRVVLTNNRGDRFETSTPLEVS